MNAVRDFQILQKGNFWLAPTNTVAEQFAPRGKGSDAMNAGRDFQALPKATFGSRRLIQ
jgi:hypothetical protein